MAKAKVDNFFSRGRRRSFSRGEVIVADGQETELAHRVDKGFVKVVSYSDSGTERTHFIYGPGDLFPMGVLFQRPFPGVCFMAATDVEVNIKPLKDFWEFIDKRPQAMRWAINILLASHDRIYGLHLNKAEDRVVYGINMLARNFGRRQNHETIVDFPITHQELADIVRTSRETVGLVLNRLQEEQKIVLGRRQLIVYHHQMPLEN